MKRYIIAALALAAILVGLFVFRIISITVRASENPAGSEAAASELYIEGDSRTCPIAAASKANGGIL